MNNLALFLVSAKQISSKPIRALLLVGLISFSAQIHAAALSEESAAFLASHLQENPNKQYQWLTGEVKKQVTLVLDHPYYTLRVPYWQSGRDDNRKTVWILEEIGKHKPITVGIVIQNQQIKSLRILKFRESRGWEVELPTFTQQFDGIALKSPVDLNNIDLTTHIDGISGATLSVRAVTKLSKLALLLQQHIDTKQGSAKQLTPAPVKTHSLTNH
ncbi:FMN-binding protein [Thiomicrorhabdus arctica]|uniref:FMN-binding protein n=1 Tax=Thiomicrorhabdus arctica TaxID=131540 RepID=UPI000379A898|nr:FMN-binding protein [Thiomicrorhabdus arctica]